MSEEQPKRAFKGVWIPKEVWLSDLTPMQKMLIAEIDSLDGDKGCYASNEHLAKMMMVSEGRLANMLTELRKIGWLETHDFDGRNRSLKVTVKTSKRESSLHGNREVSLHEKREPTLHGNREQRYYGDASEEVERAGGSEQSDSEEHDWDENGEPRIDPLPTETPPSTTPPRKTRPKKTPSPKVEHPTQEEVEDYAAEIGLPRNDGKYMWLKWEEDDWKYGPRRNIPIQKWKTIFSRWKTGGYLPSQKEQANQRNGTGKTPEGRPMGRIVL